MGYRARPDFFGIAIGALLTFQMVLFWISLTGPLDEISMFCGASKLPALKFFGYLHLAFVGLFILGLLSLFWTRARPIYAGALVISLLALPLQAWLVSENYLYCDGP